MEIKFEHARALQTNLCNDASYKHSSFGAWPINSSVNKFAAGTRISSGLQKNSDDSDYSSFDGVASCGVYEEAFGGGGICSYWRGMTFCWDYTTFKDVKISIEQEAEGIIIRTVPGGYIYNTTNKYFSLGEYTLKVNNLEAKKNYYAYPFTITGSYFYLIILDEASTIWTIDENLNLFNTNIVYNKDTTLKQDLPSDAYKIPINEEVQINVDDITSNISTSATIFFDAKELKSSLLLYHIPVSLEKMAGKTLYFKFTDAINYKVV